MYSPPMTSREVETALGGSHPGGDQALAHIARNIMQREVGNEVFLRGLLEFSNCCRRDCSYCGIRRSLPDVRRFTLDGNEALRAARFCRDQGFASMTLQSGERTDQGFIEFVEGLVREIKRETISQRLPEGLGITLSIGEQSPETYERLYRAGAHRYLLRIETSNPELFSRLHPASQSFTTRVAALRSLKEIGFQLGTGIMIGIPGQTLQDLAQDIEFFRDIDADMIGMGPYIEAPGAPQPILPPAERLRLSLRMIAAVRIQLGDINIAAATALQALSPTGREQGLSFGANVLMPIITPAGVRREYQLYTGKPCVEDAADQCAACTPLRAARAGRPVGLHRWGDAPHAIKETA